MPPYSLEALIPSKLFKLRLLKITSLKQTLGSNHQASGRNAVQPCGICPTSPHPISKSLSIRSFAHIKRSGSPGYYTSSETNLEEFLPMRWDWGRPSRLLPFYPPFARKKILLRYPWSHAPPHSWKLKREAQRFCLNFRPSFTMAATEPKTLAK